MSKEINIREIELKYIPYSELFEFECNSLKESEKRDVHKLKNAIIEKEFSIPMFVWEKYILDGSGRMLALKELHEEGYKIPDLPVVFIEADNLEDAKILVLQINSQHGEITAESLDLFIDNLDLQPVELDCLNIKLLNLDAKNEESKEEKPKKATGIGHKYNFGIIIECESAEEQSEIFNKLNAEGYNCKAIYEE